MIIPKQKMGYLIDKQDYEATIKSSRLWQKQTEEELTTEEAFIDWGIAQGYINCLKQLQVISKEDYEILSKEQLKIMNLMNRLKKEEMRVNRMKSDLDRVINYLKFYKLDGCKDVTYLDMAISNLNRHKKARKVGKPNEQITNKSL